MCWKSFVLSLLVIVAASPGFFLYRRTLQVESYLHSVSVSSVLFCEAYVYCHEGCITVVVLSYTVTKL